MEEIGNYFINKLDVSHPLISEENVLVENKYSLISTETKKSPYLVKQKCQKIKLF